MLDPCPAVLEARLLEAIAAAPVAPSDLRALIPEVFVERLAVVEAARQRLERAGLVVWRSRRWHAAPGACERLARS